MRVLVVVLVQLLSCQLLLVLASSQLVYLVPQMLLLWALRVTLLLRQQPNSPALVLDTHDACTFVAPLLLALYSVLGVLSTVCQRSSVWSSISSTAVLCSKW